MVLVSATGRPSRSWAAWASTSIAGHRWGSRRRSNETAWLDSRPTRGKIHRSEDTPRREAVSTEHSTSAAAWSTVHWVECHLLYGNASGRFVGEGGAIY